MSAMGLAMPNTNAQALMRTPNAAGSASALLGTSSFLIGAIASPLVGIAGEATAVPMAVVQLASAVARAALLPAAVPALAAQDGPPRLGPPDLRVPRRGAAKVDSAR